MPMVSRKILTAFGVLIYRILVSSIRKNPLPTFMAAFFMHFLYEFGLQETVKID